MSHYRMQPFKPPSLFARFRAWVNWNFGGIGDFNDQSSGEDHASLHYGTVIKAMAMNPTVKIYHMVSKRITIDALFQLMMRRKIEAEISPFNYDKTLIMTIRVVKPFRSVFHYSLATRTAMLTDTDRMVAVIESLRLDCAHNQLSKLENLTQNEYREPTNPNAISLPTIAISTNSNL